MARDLSFKIFLKDLGMRIGAAVIVVGMFFSLGYINRTDLFNLSNLLGGQVAFFTVTFLLVGTVSMLDCVPAFQRLTPKPYLVADSL